MAVTPIQLISAANAAVTQTSVPLDLGNQSLAAIHVYFSSATLNGTLKLQASIGGAQWADIPNSSQTVTSGSGYVYNISDAGYNYVRAVWTPSSGTGTLTAEAEIKTTVHSR